MPKLLIDATNDLPEIIVTDGLRHIVGKSFGKLSLDVPIGIFNVRFEYGRQYHQLKPILIDGPNVVIAGTDIPTFFSAAPLVNTTNITENLIENSHDLSKRPFVNKGSGAHIFVFIRNNSAKPCAQLEKEVALLGANEQPVANFEGLCKTGKEGDFSACCLEVTPGFYILRLNGPAGQVVNIPVHALPDWRSDIFLLHDHDALGACFIDPDTASIVFTRKGEPFNPEAEAHRKCEVVKHILLSPPKSDNDWQAVIEPLMQAAFNSDGYPMLPLLFANLLIAAVPPNVYVPDVTAALSEIRARLEQNKVLLPDIIAIPGETAEGAKGNVSNPPLLQASWKRLIERSSVDTTICPAGSIAATIAEKRWGLGIFAYWQNEAPTSTRDALEWMLEKSAKEALGEPADPASELAVLAKLSPYEEATARGVSQSQQMQAQQMQYQIPAKSPYKSIPLARFITTVSSDDTSGSYSGSASEIPDESSPDFPAFRQKLCEQLDLPWGTIEVILERIRHKVSKVRAIK